MFATETEFIRWLQRQAPGRAPGLRLGIGDDAALVEIRRGYELILTTDLSIEGVHFLRHLHPPRAVGHRALARSLSDVAAMGGTPRYALISLAISARTSRAWLQEFYAGVFALAQRFAVTVVGGDTAVVPGSMLIDVTVAGEVERGKAIRRSGARPGDQIFVSGRLGLSALGLRWIQTKASAARRGKGALGPAPARGKMRDPVRVHFYPEPRCALGRFLCEKNLASSLIDLSDGLSTDLTRLCEASNVGARIWAERIPVPDIPAGSKPGSLRAMDLALNGGEDYELLFSVPSRKAPQIAGKFNDVPLHCIGEICRSKEILLVLTNGKQAPLSPAGYDHFAKVSSTSRGQRAKSR
jgi:thiamine-monophosphate kinase